MDEENDHNVLEIEGGVPLKGAVYISGAKNETTKLMVASTILDAPVTLQNVPHIGDVAITSELLHSLGVQIQYSEKNKTLRLDVHGLSGHQAIYESKRANRLSVLLAGPLLYHFGEAVVQKPGGCKIGERPLDQHLFYLHKLGITIDEQDTVIKLKGKLRGAVIDFPYKSVGATEGALLAAVRADGQTVIRNPANEPEITEQIKFLQRAGVIISYAADGSIIIQGTSAKLRLEHPVRMIGDRVEAISYAAAAVATGGNVELLGIQHHQIVTAISALRQCGAEVIFTGDSIVVQSGEKILPYKLETDPHPAFATDFQQVFVVLMSGAEGVSYMHETVFDNRFKYIEQLNKLGGNFVVSTKCLPFNSCRFANLHEHTTKINGPTHFYGGQAEITDLRAAFALTIAGLLAKTPTQLTNAHHLLRGYDHPIDKLTALGAKIKLIEKD